MVKTQGVKKGNLYYLTFKNAQHKEQHLEKGHLPYFFKKVGLIANIMLDDDQKLFFGLTLLSKRKILTKFQDPKVSL